MARVRIHWAVCLGVTAIAFVSVAAGGEQAPVKQGAGSVASVKGTEILWDKYGVPHIFAKTNAGAFHALGWAQMEAHGDLILRLYGEARGRAAEYWGAGQNFESDRWVRTMGIPARAKEWVAQQALIGYGNWTQAGSKHVSDQLEFLARKQLRPVWRTRKEVEANLDGKKIF